MTAAEVIERLVEIDRPEYAVIVQPSVEALAESAQAIAEGGWAWARIVDVRRGTEGGCIFLVCE